MGNLKNISLILVTIFSFIHFWALSADMRWIVYITKPSVILILMNMVWRGGLNTGYRKWILFGLGFSLIGDVFLMLPHDLFIPGLISFLIAHLFYIVAFSTARKGLSLWAICLCAVYSAGILFLLWPYLGGLKIPVLCYLLVITLMGSWALSNWGALKTKPAVLAAIGALFFMASDTILAFARFRGGFDHHSIWVMATYFIAQTLIALSVF